MNSFATKMAIKSLWHFLDNESKHAYKAQGEGLVINDGESRHEGFAELGDELDFEYQLTCPIKHCLSAPAVFEDHCSDGLIHCVSFTLPREPVV